MQLKLLPLKIVLLIQLASVLNSSGIPVYAQAEIDSILIHSDSAEVNFWPNVIKSAIVPGWGQIEQQNPGRAFIFYSLSVHFVHNLAFHINKSGFDNSYRLRQNSILLSQVYLLNMLDVVQTQLSGENLEWNPEMFSDQPLKSPWGAVARSAMVPGWGQVYNEEYLKSAISAGLFINQVYKVYYYNKRYKETGDKIFRIRRSANSWNLGLVYVLNLVDAYVDAYLYKFDEMMELTVNYDNLSNQYLLGLTIGF